MTTKQIQTRIRWHQVEGRRPLEVGTELQVHHFAEDVHLGYPGSCVLLGEPISGEDLDDDQIVRVVEVSDDGTEAEVIPALNDGALVRQARPRQRRIVRLLSEVRRRALWITTPRQTLIRWHGHRPLEVGTELRVRRTDHLDGRVQIRLGYPGSGLLLGEPLIGHELTNCQSVKVVAVSGCGTEAEVKPIWTHGRWRP